MSCARDPISEEVIDLALPARRTSDPETIAIGEGILLAFEKEPFASLHGFNFHFEADFLKIRDMLDPKREEEPVLLEEVFLDTPDYALAKSTDFYKRVLLETTSGLQLQVPKEDCKHILESYSSPQDGHCALRFREFSHIDHIDAHLRQKYENKIQSTAALTHLVVRFYVLRWQNRLHLCDDLQIDIQLDSVLLQSGKFYDIGMLKLRCTSPLKQEVIKKRLEHIKSLQNIQVAYTEAPTKFCVAISDLKNRLTSIDAALDPYATALTRIKRLSPQWMLWSMEEDERS